MLNFSTESLSTHRRAMEYSDVLARYYSRIEPDRSIVYDIEADELLEARSSGCALGALSYSRHQCNSRRHRYLISRRSDRADYSLQFVRTGNLTLASDDRELRLNAGDMAFIRPSRAVEYRVDPGGSETFGVHIPWRIAEALSYGEEIALDTVFSRQSGIGACVAAILEAITQTEGHFSNAESASIQTILARTLIQLGVSANEIPGPNRARREMLHTVKSVSLASLDDPELSPNGIASRVGISVRTLHRYFEASGESFWAWVRDRRLERCYEEITDPTYARHSITEIAFRWGYNELSTFDRNFRQRYGMCPRAARARGAQQVRDN